MNECLKLLESNCKNCYKCIRHCPVKAISFKSNQANIIQRECILCGECFVICPQNAKSIRDDIPVAKRLLKENSLVYASIAPSFVANYGVGINSMRKALQKLGFAEVEETAIGATVVKNHYDAMVEAGESSIIISSCCNTVNLMIQQYYPTVLPYLAKIQSPMQAHSTIIKHNHPEAKTVFIGPCISKKAEGDRYARIVDCVLTFDELTKWLSDENITFDSDVIEEQGGKASLFPIAGGILRSMKADSENYSYLVIDGLQNCISALEDIISGNLDNCFIEMSACRGSCIGGPAMKYEGSAPIRSYIAVNKYANDDDFTVEMPDVSLLKKNIDFLDVHTLRPGKSAIEEVLRRMGKRKPADELNCGSCGYDTCREKAIAILAGKADASMCLPYLMERAQSFSDTIISNTPNGVIVLNEFLKVQQINNAACSIMNIKDQQDVLGRQVVCILDPTPFLDVINSHKNIYDRGMYLAEYDRYVMLTVIYDHSFHVIISIMRDITENETERVSKENRDRKTIEIADKVIEKQMRTVQEIASLLGETTAETKIALTKLKETLLDE